MILSEPSETLPSIVASEGPLWTFLPCLAGSLLNSVWQQHNRKKSRMKKFIALICSLALFASLLSVEQATALAIGEVLYADDTTAVIHVNNPDEASERTSQNVQAPPHTSQKASGVASNQDEARSIHIRVESLIESDEVVVADEETLVVDLTNASVIDNKPRKAAVTEETDEPSSVVFEGSIVAIKDSSGAQKPKHDEHPPREEPRARREREEVATV